MYQYHLKEMVERLSEWIPAPDREKAVQKLAEYWNDKIAVSWSTEDVMDMAEAAGRKPITEEDARNVLQQALRKFDAAVGMNWDVLETHLDVLLANKEDESPSEGLNEPAEFNNPNDDPDQEFGIGHEEGDGKEDEL